MRRVISDYGMIFVLLALCALFSLLTLKRQMPEGEAAAKEIALRIEREFSQTDVIVAAGAVNTDSAALAEDVGERLIQAGFEDVRVMVGEPRDLRVTLGDYGLGFVVVTGQHGSLKCGHHSPTRPADRVPDRWRYRGAPSQACSPG